MKVGLAGILQNPSVRMSSHNAGWTHVYLSMLKKRYGDVDVLNDDSNWNDYHIIYINEGVNFKQGVWNLFGGVSDKLINKLKQLNNYKGKLCFWGDFKPNYDELVTKRKIDKLKLGETYNIPNKSIKVLSSLNYSNKLVLGDSHTISVYSEGFDIKRMDGKTMYGLISEGIHNHIQSHHKTIRLYIGNIDVRHHICRRYTEEERFSECNLLISKLETQLKELQRNNIKIEVVELLPIENVSRKIPKTGYYNNQPYWGTWEERNEVKTYLNANLYSMCLRLKCEFLRWPNITNDKHELDFKHMEAKQSVHLAPSSYMFSFIKNEKPKSSLTLF